MQVFFADETGQLPYRGQDGLGRRNAAIVRARDGRPICFAASFSCEVDSPADRLS